MRLTHLRDLNVAGQLAAGHSFLSAGSGLVQIGARFCVIADDDHQLGVFSLAADQPGKLLRILPGALSADQVARKATKPDFEILLQLPAASGLGESCLFAMGSGSTAQRMRGAIITLGSGGNDATVQIVDLRPLFDLLAPFVSEINLEGAFVRGDCLVLLNRGNMAAPETCIFETTLSSILNGEVTDVTLVKTLRLPSIAGVPLSVADAVLLENGAIILSAVAEATSNSYADGALCGAAIMQLDSGYNLLRLEPVEPAVKIEGIEARQIAEGIEIFCVSDADDPEKPSALYCAVLPST